MTVAQLQNLRSFAHLHLADVVDWARDVRVDEKATTGDQAFVVIKTPYNSYKMSVLSSYITPPPGAPTMCSSLGTVTFDDLAGDKHVVGPKADNTYNEISAHIHQREYTDALAICRRDLAEAPKDRVPIVRAKLAGLIAGAKKWGVKVSAADELAATVAEVPVNVAPKLEELAQTAVPPIEDADLRPSPHIIYGRIYGRPEAPVTGEAFVGMPVIFVTNPGEQINGMQEIPGTIVAINDDKVAVFVTPANSEPRYYDRLPRRSAIHKFNCWDVSPWFAALLERINKLEHPVIEPAPTKTEVFFSERLAKLEARLDKLIEKPKRARPPKAKAADPEPGED